ncbi:MAG: bifunctional riboflavin kinase/FAD synthetase [Saccharospirillaceae bacterium]|nr:bifunctional riboflavin kinase/FAD synthetase [Pseudomonadales bacterium]NRB78928.1 bifunctional riboflavin kinase/FAD synthetase [Saccharospirillaceae bacterium]
MRFFKHPTAINNKDEKPSVVCIGNFDAVHLGHQTLIKRARVIADEQNLQTVACFFEPQPKEFFLKDKAPHRITNLRNKVFWLDHYAVDVAYCVDFNKNMQTLSAKKFVEQILLKQLNAKAIIVGDDFRFGCNRDGDFKFLSEFLKPLGVYVEQAQSVIINNARVSSSMIRECLDNADIKTTNQLLGRQYSIIGKVVKGNQLGRTINTPTANISLKTKLPAIDGVWACNVTINNHDYDAVANVGARPTLNSFKPILEVHILDFDQDIYDQIIETRFVKKIRDIKKFNSLDELKAQIQQDIQQAKTIFQQAN